jgi:hypothetical protein
LGGGSRRKDGEELQKHFNAKITQA